MDLRPVLEKQLTDIVMDIHKAIKNAEKAEKDLANLIEELKEIMEAIDYFNKRE